MKKNINKNKALQRFESIACNATQLRSTRGGTGTDQGGESPPVPPKSTQASNGS